MAAVRGWPALGVVGAGAAVRDAGAGAAAEPYRRFVAYWRPLNEAIAQHGPFVMNTQEEIFQAVRDCQSGRSARACAEARLAQGAPANNARPAVPNKPRKWKRCPPPRPPRP
mgnify:CR=1 FL=1